MDQEHENQRRAHHQREDVSEIIGWRSNEEREPVSHKRERRERSRTGPECPETQQREQHGPSKRGWLEQKRERIKIDASEREEVAGLRPCAQKRLRVIRAILIQIVSYVAEVPR